jgi:outer membrane immunogenic protein
VTGYEAKIEWFGTVRGRLGVLITDRVLLYGTGGLAYGQVKLSSNTLTNGAVIDLISGPNPFGPPNSAAFSTSKTNVGFSVGGGIEGIFSLWLPANWTWKLEYLYLDLGSLDTAASFATGLPGGLLGQEGFGSPLTMAITTHTHFTDNIVRVGLNYQFH